ncbi:metallophosphoesterase [Mucilaginibacter sp.]|uniref:metallophosphoesterase n=1 Tax=Mucilaginibacter sp. TaxID=1882438 RepID=UPI0028435104|nr:metallophosphoesterase [Mucilaginibacter sp.]MDR3696081.1 metallophosphoesterase [Mucilaginibacter sp.]
MNYLKKHLSVVALCLLLASLTLRFTRFPKAAIKAPLTQKCLIVSDIHFNPFYGTTTGDSVLAKKLISSSYAEWKQYFEGFAPQTAINTNLMFKDANYGVLQSALVNMKKRLPDPAFILIAGDFIWHGATPADSVLKKKCILFIAGLFKEYFPNALIIPAMGNNDTYGKDYALQDPKFLNDFATAWKPNLPGPSADSLRAKGYYTAETGNLRMVVMNSAPLNSGSNYQPQADAMLRWMDNNLANANGKNIWILLHIPPGLNAFNLKNFWNTAYADAFVHTIVKHAASVKLIIGSHIHLNDFKVVYDHSRSPKPVALMRIVPSICSNHGNNPSFEVAEFNTATGNIVNETNWYLNLATIQKDKETTQLAWTDTLNSAKSLEMKGLSAGDFSKLIDHIKADKTGQMIKRYADFYDVATKADSAIFINHATYMNYLKADSLKEK